MDDLPAVYYYAGATLELPQALATALKAQGAAVVDMSFGVSPVNPFAYTTASLRYIYPPLPTTFPSWRI